MHTLLVLTNLKNMANVGVASIKNICFLNHRQTLLVDVDEPLD